MIEMPHTDSVSSLEGRLTILSSTFGFESFPFSFVPESPLGEYCSTVSKNNRRRTQALPWKLEIWVILYNTCDRMYKVLALVTGKVITC
jgi:hypothetical protein